MNDIITGRIFLMIEMCASFDFDGIRVEEWVHLLQLTHIILKRKRMLMERTIMAGVM